MKSKYAIWKYATGLGLVVIIILTGLLIWNLSQKSEPVVTQYRPVTQPESGSSTGMFNLVIIIFVAIIGLGVIAAAVLALREIDRKSYRQHYLIAPDRRGFLPVARLALESGTFDPVAAESIMAFHAAQAIRAGRQPVPYNYSPHIVYGGDRGAKSVSSLPEVGFAELKPTSVPTFAELLARGEVGQGLLLGYTAGEPLRGGWRDLYSAAIAGMSGSGKTTTVRFIACQSALLKAQFVIIDPHGDSGEESLAETLMPLQDSFLFDPAILPHQMLSALKATEYELQQRLADKERPRYPLIVCVDEMTSLMRTDLAKPLAGLLQDVSQQGRKVGIFALCMGQIWKGSTSGGTELRDSFASKYVHRLARNQARMLLPTEEAATVERLPAGQAVLCRTNGDLIPVSIPLTTGSDVTSVARLIATRAKPERNQNETIVEVVSMASQSDKTVSPEEARIITLFREGKDVGEIVKELHGTSSGSIYQKRSAAVQAAIRKSFE